MKINVIHIPEKCYFNDFIERTIKIQSLTNINVLDTNICFDGFEGSTYDLDSINAYSDELKRNLIVHFHWPEKLYSNVSPQKLIQWIKDAKKLGVSFVKTVHNLKAHEKSLQTNVDSQFDQLMDGFIFFSEAQRKYFDSSFEYNGITRIIPHPNYLTEYCFLDKHKISNHSWHFLCIGRIRTYKQFQIIEDLLKYTSNKNLIITVAGKPDDIEICDKLDLYSKIDKRLKCIFEFLSHDKMKTLMCSADAILLPYPEVWSSGIAVLASNLGCPLVGKQPYMFKDYNASETGVFDTSDRKLDSKMLCELIETAMFIGKKELFIRARKMHDILKDNNDEYLSRLYQDLYLEIKKDIL